jgi:hypothetical protein
MALGLLFLTGMINQWPIFASVDEAVSGAGGARATAD